MSEDSLERLKQGDPALFAELVRDHHRALVALVTSIVGTSEAEEVVQNAWLKAYQAIAGFEERSQIRTWLARIAINEAKMQLRKRKRELLFSDWGEPVGNSEAMSFQFKEDGHWSPPPGHWHGDSPDSLLMGEQLAECLDRLLTNMPTNQRVVLEMRDASGLDFEEICNDLAISASNARVLLHRARTQLFKLVDHYQETGEC